MSIAGEEEPDNMGHPAPDPLLNAGAFIDPTPTSNGTSVPETASDLPEPTCRENSPETPQPSDRQEGSGPLSDDAALTSKPDWLPSGWKFIERVRSSGASAGTRDKYYLDPVSNRQFRSKKEVLYYLETGSVKKKKRSMNSDTENTAQANSQTPKRNKAEAKAKELAKYFDFDDIPAKVKWELTDIYEGTWRPLINGVDRVPESSKQEWSAAFTYLTLQNGGRGSY
uniref:MBD domain-containing protein n=1 Tax=Opuntia streptacantha TaxID=393608 RepID=A0A7C8ZQK5_OPUST